MTSQISSQHIASQNSLVFLDQYLKGANIKFDEQDGHIFSH